MLNLKIKIIKKRSKASQVELDNDWKSIKGFPHYKINRKGQIKRIDAIVTDCRGINFFRKGRILSTR